MLRPCSALLLLLILTSPGVAQAPAPAAWALRVGGYTIYGHTTYSPTVVLLPRIVFDTARGVDSARVVDSVRATAKPAFAAGLNAWPTESYCTGPVSATMQQVDPKIVLERIQLAARCGVRLVLVPPRRRLTTNGLAQGPFSVDSARRLTDRYAAVLPSDTLRKYRPTIIGFNLTDDYGCTQCWGGKAISQTEIAAWAAYARGKLPDLPLGVRVTPDWVAEYPPLAPLIDYAWAQYHSRKGEPQAFYDSAATIARRLGIRVAMGVNVQDCAGGESGPCTAADLLRFGTMAVSHPASCAFINWRYDEATWARAEIRESWTRLFDLARARSSQDCRASRMSVNP